MNDPKPDATGVNSASDEFDDVYMDEDLVDDESTEDQGKESGAKPNSNQYFEQKFNELKEVVSSAQRQAPQQAREPEDPDSDLKVPPLPPDYDPEAAYMDPNSRSFQYRQQVEQVENAKQMRSMARAIYTTVRKEVMEEVQADQKVRKIEEAESHIQAKYKPTPEEMEGFRNFMKQGNIPLEKWYQFYSFLEKGSHQISQKRESEEEYFPGIDSIGGRVNQEASDDFEADLNKFGKALRFDL